LDFGIRLDKNSYEAGETASGTLFTKSDKNLKVRRLKFSVCGKERYEAGMSGGMSTAGISGDDSHRSDKYDIFFFDDLTPHLKSTFAFSETGANDIEIPRGSYGIPFNFSIPANALESYQGKHARIMYEVEVVANMGRWKRDYHYTLPFAVINPKMDYRIGDRYYLDKEQDKEEGQPLLDMILLTVLLGKIHDKSLTPGLNLPFDFPNSVKFYLN
jgi:arrestin (S-antigen)-like protein